MGLLGGVVKNGIRAIPFESIVIEEAIVEAFRAVEDDFKSSGFDLRFWMTIHEYHGGSSDAGVILRYWLGPFATLDSPDVTYRLRVSDELTENLLDEVPGNREIYEKGGRVFCESLHKSATHH